MVSEGTAQYQTKDIRYDTWDSHRDMILRTRILSDTYLSLKEMGTFSSKTSIERETVYNQGFGFVIYLAQRFGDDVLRKISNNLGESKLYTVEKALEMATGESGTQIFDDWIEERKNHYESIINDLILTNSDYIESDGFFNFYPKVSPDGSTVAYLSNKGRDHSTVSLYLQTDNDSSLSPPLMNIILTMIMSMRYALNPQYLLFLPHFFFFTGWKSNCVFSKQEK